MTHTVHRVSRDQTVLHIHADFGDFGVVYTPSWRRQRS